MSGSSRRSLPCRFRSRVAACSTPSSAAARSACGRGSRSRSIRSKPPRSRQHGLHAIAHRGRRSAAAPVPPAASAEATIATRWICWCRIPAGPPVNESDGEHPLRRRRRTSALARRTIQAVATSAPPILATRVAGGGAPGEPAERCASKAASPITRRTGVQDPAHRRAGCFRRAAPRPATRRRQGRRRPDRTPSTPRPIDAPDLNVASGSDQGQRLGNEGGHLARIVARPDDERALRDDGRRSPRSELLFAKGPRSSWGLPRQTTSRSIAVRPRRDHRPGKSAGPGSAPGCSLARTRVRMQAGR